MTKTKDEEIVTVPATSDMDTATFCKHFNMRHSESLAGLKALDPDRFPFEVEQQYRAFHIQLHRARANYRHRHAKELPVARIEYALKCLEENGLTGWRQIAGANGVVACFPGGEYAVRLNGKTTHHNSAEEAATVMVRE